MFPWWSPFMCPTSKPCATIKLRLWWCFLNHMSQFHHGILFLRRVDHSYLILTTFNFNCVNAIGCSISSIFLTYCTSAVKCEHNKMTHSKNNQWLILYMFLNVKLTLKMFGVLIQQCFQYIMQTWEKFGNEFNEYKVATPEMVNFHDPNWFLSASKMHILL
jgi:hypothetical protein